MKFKVTDLGLIDYQRAWNIQKEALCYLRDTATWGCLFFCRHYPVITMGRLTRQNSILVDEKTLKEKSITCYRIERGGDATYHGPGQLTVYPIFNLGYFKKDIHWFLRQLEAVAISLLADFNITANRRSGFTGAWVREDKIASIGIAVKNWITYHGMSVIIKKTDLENFSLIRPCGMDIAVTSMENILNREVDFGQAKEKLCLKFSQFFN